MAVAGVDHAFRVFFAHVQAIAWLPVVYALACQCVKMAVRSRAWRNILAAAYPESNVRWRSVFGAYAAGVGVNAVIPVRGGDLLRLFLVRRRVKGATYPTLAATLLVETLVDAVLSAALLVWALETHVLPGVNVLHRLPSIDWFWLFQHPRSALLVIGATLVLGFAVGFWAAARIAAFRRRVAQGFAVLRTPGRYFRSVVLLQLLDWVFRLAVIYFFLRAFHVHPDVHNALRVQVTDSLSTIVPLTPAGIGTAQALIVYVLHGQASRSALHAFSVGLKTIISAVNVAFGLAAIALMLRTLHWRRAVEQDEALDRAGKQGGQSA
jgi:uncharacterized membrane protein YbhN (UPF0104 family)